MNKFFVRLFVACTCFVLSVALTSFSKLFRSADSAIDVVALQPAEPNFDFSDDEVQLREIYREYGPAQTRHDRAFFEKIEADDFRLFFDGKSLSREEDIQWMERTPTSMVFDNQPEYIKIFGNSAVVRGRLNVRYSNGYVYPGRYIDVWVRRGDRWQIQSTTSGY
jgi:hypothetical protein